MRKFINITGMFTVGAIGYGLIEILWRGRTHWSMLSAGGLCFVLLGKLESVLEGSRRIVKCIAGSALITAVEFIYGVIFNKLLNLSVWDYSNIPFNFLGQICPLYSVLWAFLCLPFMPIANRFYRKITLSLVKERNV